MRTHALIGIAWLSLAGCYSPELRDCTVTCSATDECAEDQVCTGGLCRTEGATCGAGSGSTAKVQLRVEVIGEGMVVVDGIGTCASNHGNDQCMWMIAMGRQLQLDAMVLDDKEFERWTTANCADQSQDKSCTLTATSAILVGAKFE